MVDTIEAEDVFTAPDPLAGHKAVQASTITKARVTYVGDMEEEANHKPRLGAFGRFWRMGDAVLVKDVAIIKKCLGNRFFKVEEVNEEAKPADGAPVSDSPDAGGKSAPKAGRSDSSGGKPTS